MKNKKGYTVKGSDELTEWLEKRINALEDSSKYNDVVGDDVEIEIDGEKYLSITALKNINNLKAGTFLNDDFKGIAESECLLASAFSNLAKGDNSALKLSDLWHGFAREDHGRYKKAVADGKELERVDLKITPSQKKSLKNVMVKLMAKKKKSASTSGKKKFGLSGALLTFAGLLIAGGIGLFAYDMANKDVKPKEPTTDKEPPVTEPGEFESFKEGVETLPVDGIIGDAEPGETETAYSKPDQKPNTPNVGFKDENGVEQGTLAVGGVGGLLAGDSSNVETERETNAETEEEIEPETEAITEPETEAVTEKEEDTTKNNRPGIEIETVDSFGGQAGAE